MDIGEQLEHLGLTPNVLVRGMCRKYLEQVLTLPFDNLFEPRTFLNIISPIT